MKNISFAFALPSNGGEKGWEEKPLFSKSFSMVMYKQCDYLCNLMVLLMAGLGLNNGATTVYTLMFSNKQTKKETKRETTTWKFPREKNSCPNLSKCIDILWTDNNKESITCLVPEILHFHYCWKSHLKSTWSWWCMLFTLLKKHPLQIGGKVRNDLYCIDQFIRVVFRQIVLMELHFLLFSWRPIFCCLLKRSMNTSRHLFTKQDDFPLKL